MMQTLTGVRKDYLNQTKCCPYCGQALTPGPRGGLARNAICDNELCKARFNLHLGGIQIEITKASILPLKDQLKIMGAGEGQNNG